MARQNFSTDSPFEPVVGYSRAVRVGNQVFVTGTTAPEELGEYAQTAAILRKIEAVLRRAGAELRHVVRTRMFVTDISRWEDIGRAHREFFADILPCTTMVEVKALIDPSMLVEIEADAIIAD